MSSFNCIVIAVLAGWVYGYNTAIIGGLTHNGIVNNYFGPDNKNIAVYTGMLTASILVGAIAGSYGIPPVADKLGRKKALQIIGLVCVVFAVLLALMTNFWLLVVMRLLLGISVGGAGCVAPLYVSEMAPEAHRGKLGTVFQISICATILLAEIANYVGRPDESVPLTEFSWRLQFALGAVPGVLLIILMPFMTESSKWLAQNSVGEETPNVYAKPMTHSSSSASIADLDLSLFSVANFKWIAVGTVLAATNQLTGINAVIFYAQDIFAGAGLSNVAVITIAVVGTWNLLTVFISFVLVDRLGRKKLMVGSLALMGTGSLLLGLAYTPLLGKGSAHTVVTIGATMLFIMAFEVGPGPLFFLMAAETFPAQLSAQALSYTNAAAWMFNLMVSFGFGPLNHAIGNSGTFFIFCGSAYLTCFYIFFNLPEPARSSIDLEEQEGISSAVGIAGVDRESGV